MEAALSIYLENFATTLGSREQLAIAEFADALLTIPKTLAVNAAQVCLHPECTASSVLARASACTRVDGFQQWSWTSVHSPDEPQGVQTVPGALAASA